MKYIGDEEFQTASSIKKAHNVAVETDYSKWWLNNKSPSFDEIFA